MSKNDISGHKFGYWTVLRRDTEFKGSYSKWICQCECGSVRSVSRSSLISGRSSSCGCHSFDNRKGMNATHGMSKTRLYHEWTSMRRRCSHAEPRTKNAHYLNISVCDEWNNSFVAFRDWAMSNGYSDSLTIDRIDNSKGYCPENCRWITIAEQQSNRTNTIYVDYNGEKWCLRTLCNKIGFPYKNAHRRFQKMMKRGQPIDTDKLFAPIDSKYISFRYRNED